ncbi:MAG: NAD(P)/FAD-dependent oxidoreductase [Dehalococcoidia bacterium]
MTNADRDVDVAVVGAGVVGLAVAAALARTHSVALIERHPGIARETSSHNSQVVHAGIYYPTGSLKHLLCLEGRALLYEWCAARGVPIRRTGKLIVATHPSELPGLDGVWEQARRNGVEGMSRLTEAAARALEPAVPAVGALHSEATGAVDAFAYARSLEATARADGAMVALAHEVRAASRDAESFTLELIGPDGAPARLRCAAIVNAAGHGAPALAASLGYPLDGAEGVPALRQRPNQGRYYDVAPSAARAVSRHVYPVPHGTRDMPEFMRRAGGLGVHLTVDIDGGVHLGPDTEWLEEGATLDYRSDDTRRAAFLAAGQRLLPHLTDDDIAPGQVGYRPKLTAAGSEDFVIWADRGYVHLGGIESPGLTASLAIADRVARLL